MAKEWASSTQSLPLVSDSRIMSRHLHVGCFVFPLCFGSGSDSIASRSLLILFDLKSLLIEGGSCPKTMRNASLNLS